MKKIIFMLRSNIFFLLLPAFILTGCGTGVSKTPDIAEDKRETPETNVSDTESFGPSFSPDMDNGFDADPVFPETAPFIDDTGKTSMQRDGDYLYSYFDGRLMRTHGETGETTLLYQTSYLHKLRFCLSEDYIYFIERTGADSSDQRDTSLYRMEKDGENLTLLQDHILNVSSVGPRGIYPFNIVENDAPYLYDPMGDYNDAGIYESIDLYDDIIYLIDYSYIYGYEYHLPVSASVYFKLNEDGTVQETDEKETLYGKLPQGFFPVARYDSFPSFPYAMRNYGYLFVQDTDKNVYRMDPTSGAMESLGISSDDLSDFAFSGDTIFLKPDDTIFLFNLSDKTMIRSEDIWSEKAYFYGVFPTEQGFLYCGKLYTAEYATDTAESPGSYICHILPDGSADLVFSGLPDSPEYPGSPIGYRTNDRCCIFGDYFYYIDTGEAEHSLMRLSLREKPDFQKLQAWSLYPAETEMIEKDEEIAFGDSDSLFSSMKLLFLKEQTDADVRINQALTEIYADFETDINDRVQYELSRSESHPEYLQDTLRCFSDKKPDFQVSVFCNYMDDDTVSFACFFTYFPYGLFSQNGCDYYVFDRHTGKQLTFEDFEGDPSHIIDVISPYLNRAVTWEISPENILDPRRFSLSDDGYTLFFTDTTSRVYEWFSVTIPYGEFEKEP